MYNDIILIILGFFILVIFIGIIFLIFSEKKKKSRLDKKLNDLKKIETADAIHNLKKMLARNYNNWQARYQLAKMYIKDTSYLNAVKELKILIDMSATNKEINELEVTSSMAECYLHLDNKEEAYKNFLICRTVDELNFDANYHLGMIDFKNKIYEKACLYLGTAVKIHAENFDALKYYGLSLYKLNKFNEAREILKQALQLNSNDRECIFHLGNVFYNLNQQENAIKIFNSLKEDPEFGIESTILSGTIKFNRKQFTEAINDFQLITELPGLPVEKKIEVYYKIAESYINMQELQKAVSYWQKVHNINPNYKQVSANLNKYRELDENQQLKKYLLSSVTEFAVLARKIMKMYIPKEAKAKIVAINKMKDTTVESIIEVSTRDFEDTYFFKFLRTNTTTGELTLREMYSKIKEIKAGRGICISAGNYSDTAKTFVEARLIDLVDISKLKKILHKIA